MKVAIWALVTDWLGQNLKGSDRQPTVIWAA